jgi:hypothetical protein
VFARLVQLYDIIDFPKCFSAFLSRILYRYVFICMWKLDCQPEKTRRLMVFRDGQLRRTFETKREEVTGLWRKPWRPNKDIRNLYGSTNIVLLLPWQTRLFGLFPFRIVYAVWTYVHCSYYGATEWQTRSPKFYYRGVQPTYQHHYYNFYKSVT